MRHHKNTNYISKYFRAVALVAVLTFSFMAVLPARAHAAPAPEVGASQDCDDNKNARLLGLIPKWYKYLDYEKVNGGDCAVRIDFRDNIAGILPIGLAVIEILLAVAGIVSVVFVMIGGLRYVTSQGEPDGTRAAQQTIINALVGGVIAIIATSLVTFIGNRFS